MFAGPTILAVASPPGRSLRGIIRISGADALALVDARASLTNEARVKPPARGVFPVRLSMGEGASIAALMLRFHAPRSYTGEDSVELQLPGNPALLDRVVDFLLEDARRLSIDARRAEPGEFTARAFLNNRLSLTQAEGVAATIAAQSDAELAAARMLLTGRVGDLAHALADELAAALALVEAGIDFTDQEDVVAIGPADLHGRLSHIASRLRDELAHAVGIEQLRAIPWVVLVGEPNAGKSALFNALLGRERAVVSHVAGTTRDVLAEPLTIDTPHGLAEVMLVDLAGLDADDATEMNQRMQAAARDAIERAELRLRCVPADDETSKRQDVKTSKAVSDEILVRTKCDVVTSAQSSSVNGQSSIDIPVSAVTGEGLDDLRHAIAERLTDRAVSLAAGALALQPRHEQAIRSALSNIEEAIMLVEPQRSERAMHDPEIIAAAMRAALNHLASLAGDITPDDILGRIFAGFCIGK
jgi:tRNA modification GTPase